MSHWRKDCRGITMVELLVALAMLGIGIVAVAYMVLAAIRGNGISFRHAVADTLATDLLEKARNLSYTDSRLAATSGFVNPPSSLSSSNPLGANGNTTAGDGFTRTWHIQTNTPMANVKTISVQITWNDYGKTKSVTLSTMKAKGS